MTTTKPKEFSKFQAIVFPIHKFELRKFLPMSFLLFFILFVYTLVRDLKDVFVQYQTHVWLKDGVPDSSASSQLISALKLWYVLPFAFLAVMLFTVLMNKFGSKKTFYIIVSSFMVFYALFGFFLYPNLDHLMMSSEQITSMVAGVPGFFKTLVTCAGNWPITLFYIFSEIWGTMAISSLFWQFANATTMKDETKRFFGLFSLIGNAGVVIAGVTIKNALKDYSIHNVMILMLSVLLCGAFVLATYAYINKKVLTDASLFDPSQIKEKKKKSKEKVSVMDGIKFLFTNTYLLLVAVLVMGYGIAVNFAEVVLKTQMKAAFDKTEYASMQGNLSIFTGVFTIVITLFAANVLRRCKWKISAAVTPAIFLILGTIFFALTLYNKFVSPTFFGFSALTLAIWFGIIQDAMVKSVKYCLFDSTKSMAYIPLDEDTKTKGQAAVEVIGGRAGKAGASLIQQIMFGIIPGLMNHVVTIVAIFVVTVIAWIASVFRLSPKYEKAVEEMNENDEKVAVTEN
ncbi:MAG: ADP,ATP carrier protein 1 [Eubacteriales bacterium SKADARSKE-1]|nr:ADP,ATP carrier protein 1 [Eubacteriales bacterium SKADARSKE-1]